MAGERRDGVLDVFLDDRFGFVILDDDLPDGCTGQIFVHVNENRALNEAAVKCPCSVVLIWDPRRGKYRGRDLIITGPPPGHDDPVVTVPEPCAQCGKMLTLYYHQRFGTYNNGFQCCCGCPSKGVGRPTWCFYCWRRHSKRCPVMLSGQ